MFEVYEVFYIKPGLAKSEFFETKEEAEEMYNTLFETEHILYVTLSLRHIGYSEIIKGVKFR